MSTASERAKDRRTFRLEFLEDRNLLSVASPRAVVAEVARTPAAPVTSITGRVQGLMATAGLYTPTLPGFTSFSGHGTASRPVNNILFSSQHVQTLNSTAVTITQGNGLIVTYKGDKIYLAYTGTGQTAAHRSTAFSLTGTVTGGTGRFSGDTGTFTATGTINPASSRLIFSYQIALTPPAAT